MPDGSPFLYLTDRESFRNSFDFVSAYDQLRYPTSWLLNPGRSPEEVVARVTNETIAVETGEGDPLFFGVSAGAGGISRPFTALIPPSLVAYHHRWDRFYSVTGLSLSPTGHSLEPDADLESVLDGADVAGNEDCSFDARAAASDGLSQSLSYGFSRTLHRGTLKWAPRIVVFYRATTIESHFRGTIETDSEGLPGQVSIEDGYFLSYPGNGGGLGGRIDMGAVLEAGRFTGGLSLLNQIGFNTVTGTAQDLTGNTEQVRRSSAAFAPAAVVTGRYTTDTGKPVLVTDADVIVGEAVSGHLSGSLFYPRWVFRLLLGYKAGWEGSLLAGIRRPWGTAALSLTLHQTVFAKTPVWGPEMVAKL